MAHVQAAGDVRRRDHDAEAFLAGVAVRLEVTLILPMIVQLLFDLFWVVCGVELTVCLFHSLSYSVSWRRSRGQMEADAAIGLVTVARQLFQSVFVRNEVYHFMESGSKIGKLRQQGDQQIARALPRLPGQHSSTGAP